MRNRNPQYTRNNSAPRGGVIITHLGDRRKRKMRRMAKRMKISMAEFTRQSLDHFYDMQKEAR
jgi:hypothetical protein